MKAPALYEQLRLFGSLIDKHALHPKYRALALAPAHARAVGLFGQMWADVQFGLDAEAVVDGDDFLQLLRSLPDAEFAAKVADGALRWECGTAKGHLALMGEDIPQIAFAGPAPDGSITDEFGEGIELGALAIHGKEDLRMLGLQGVQLTNRDGMAYAYATNNKTLSGCALGAPLEPDGGTITLLPQAVACLAAVLKRDKAAMLTYDASSVYCVTATRQLLLHQVTPLRTDLAKIAATYEGHQHTLPLPREAITAFMRRAEALSEEHAVVEISVKGGVLRWDWAEKTASSEEYFTVESAGHVSAPPVKVVANRLTKVLPRSDKLVFDYAEKNVLVLRGPHDFLCAVTGYREP